MIKKITCWISLISLTLFCNVSTASFINQSSLHTIDISTINTNAAETPQIDADQGTKGTAFNQELQWRILNLLTQQLFDNNYENISDMLFSNNWLYATNTFSVSISSNDPDFYQVSIVDSQQGEETQLEIPRL